MKYVLLTLALIAAMSVEGALCEDYRMNIQIQDTRTQIDCD